MGCGVSGFPCDLLDCRPLQHARVQHCHLLHDRRNRVAHGSNFAHPRIRPTLWGSDPRCMRSSAVLLPVDFMGHLQRPQSRDHGDCHRSEQHGHGNQSDHYAVDLAPWRGGAGIPHRQCRLRLCELRHGHLCSHTTILVWTNEQLADKRRKRDAANLAVLKSSCWIEGSTTPSSLPPWRGMSKGINPAPSLLGEYSSVLILPSH